MGTELVTIESDRWQVEIAPRFGATIIAGRVRHKGEWVDVLRPTPPENIMVAPDTASYPLVPFSNRIRGGVLHWRGGSHNLRMWPGQDNAMHGTGFEFPWEVVSADPDQVVLQFDSREYNGVNYPWDFVAQITYSVEEDALRCVTAVTNVDAAAFPVGMGHHPYFRRSLSDAGDAQLQLHCALEYPVEGMLVVGDAVPVGSRLDFQELRGLGTEFIDDCLTGRDGETLARIAYPDGITLRMDADDVYSHSVVYVPLGPPFFAVEPVTHANDSFNLTDAGKGELGTREIGPGEALTAEFSLHLEAAG